MFAASLLRRAASSAAASANAVAASATAASAATAAVAGAAKVAAESSTSRRARATQRRPVRLFTTVEQCQGFVERVLSTEDVSVAVDCEGHQLGRFGRLSLMQLATEDEVAIVDVETGGAPLVSALAPLLESREVVKVFHDCREDVSLLLHQYSTGLGMVFDTQVAHSLWLERQGLDLYQASLPEVMRIFMLYTYRAHRWSEFERRAIPASRWSDRPLPPQALRYAIEGVAHLLPLKSRLCKELGDPGGDLVLKRSAKYLEYAHLNSVELMSPDVAQLRPGEPLSAMLASRRSDALYFKMNHGALVGAVLDREDMPDFKDLVPGDVAACRVKHLSDCRQFVHLQREGHGELMFDFHQRQMLRMSPRGEADSRRTSSHHSSMLGFGIPKRGGGGASIEQERASYRVERPAVIHKSGKRGAVKVRDTSIKPPKKRGAS